MSEPMHVLQPLLFRPPSTSATFDPQWPEWRTQAACAGSDPNLFFPERGDDTNPAKTICRACPVKADCLAFALENREPGIWGGTSDNERARIRGNRKRPSTPTVSDHSEQARSLHRKGASVADIANALGITRRTVYRHVNRDAS